MALRTQYPAIATVSGRVDPGTAATVSWLLSRAGMEVVHGGTERADMRIVAGVDECCPSPVPLLALTEDLAGEVEALRRGAWDAVSLPLEGHGLLEAVNRLLVLETRERLTGRVLAMRRTFLLLEEAGDPARAVEFLRLAPKVVDLEALLERRLAPPGPRPAGGFAAAVAREVALRAGRDLFDDLLPLAVDLGFRLGGGTESFAGSAFYLHLLDTKIRLDEILCWRPVRDGLGRQRHARAVGYVRTPALDALALEASRRGRLPPLGDEELARLAGDLAHWQAGLDGSDTQGPTL